ncbi:MAG: hypothetical protein NC924_06280 [Candidatus Omnitrophica bacterium]|nr:hypothetical protein [Candidatus Omnitrophota bacterium]
MVKVVIAAVCAGIVAAVFFLNAAAGLGVVLAVLTVAIVFRIKIEHFILFFITVYPCLPFHAGIDFGSSLPVLRPHRVLATLLIICWLSKKTIPGAIAALGRFPLVSLVPLFIVSNLFSFGADVGGFSFAVGTFLLENVMISLIIWSVLRQCDERFVYRCVGVFAASAFIPLLIGMIEHLTQFNFYSLIAPYREILRGATATQVRLGASRIKAAFPNSIEYGLLFALLVPAAIAFFSYWENRFHQANARIWMAACLVAMWCGVWLSLSRLSIIIFMFNAFFCFLLIKPSRAAIIMLLVVLAAIPSLASKKSDSKLYHLIKGIVYTQSEQKEISSSNDARLLQIERNKAAILRSPLVGHGNAYFGGILDNYYLTVVLKVGLLGLIIFALFFILPLLSTMRAWRRTTTLQGLLSVAAGAALISVLIIFSVLSVINYLYIIWIYIGLWYGCPSMQYAGKEIGADMNQGRKAVAV